MRNDFETLGVIVGGFLALSYLLLGIGLIQQILRSLGLLPKVSPEPEKPKLVVAEPPISHPKTYSDYEFAQAHPELFKQGKVRRTQQPSSEALEFANQAVEEAGFKPSAFQPATLRLYEIGLMAATLTDDGQRLKVGILPYIITKSTSNYQRIQFTLFDHLAHTCGQWDHLYRFDAPFNLATPPIPIPIPVQDIDDRWTLDMRLDGLLFAVYHVNPTEIVDGVTDVGDITTHVGADGEIDEWARLAAAKSSVDVSLDDLLDAPATSSSKKKRNS